MPRRNSKIVGLKILWKDLDIANVEEQEEQGFGKPQKLIEKKGAWRKLENIEPQISNVEYRSKKRGREAVNPHPKKSINKRDSFLSMAGVRDQPILMNLLREMPKTQNGSDLGIANSEEPEEPENQKREPNMIPSLECVSY